MFLVVRGFLVRTGIFGWSGRAERFPYPGAVAGEPWPGKPFFWGLSRRAFLARPDERVWPTEFCLAVLFSLAFGGYFGFFKISIGALCVTLGTDF